MIRNVLIIAVILGFFSSAKAEWESIGPYGGHLQAMAVAPSNEDIIYSAANFYSEKSTFAGHSKIVKSTDGGDSWDETGLTISNDRDIFSLAVDPTTPDIVYAGGCSKVYKSMTGGAMWTEYSIPIPYVMVLKIHPTSPSTIFSAGCNADVITFLKSTDGGVTWNTVALSNDDDDYYGPHCIGIDPSNPNTIYVGGRTDNAGAYTHRVYKSTNGGTSFTEVSSGLPSSFGDFYSLSVHPTNSDIVYAGITIGIYRSTNGGSSWSKVSSKHTFSLSTSQADPNVVYAGTSTSIDKSTNSGESWVESGSNFTDVNCLTVSQTQAATVYAASSVGFYKTTNSGSNWLASNNGMNIAISPTFAIAPSSPSTIYMEAVNVGCYKTTNSGSDLTLLPEFATCGSVAAFAVHNTNPDIVFALEGGA